MKNFVLTAWHIFKPAVMKRGYLNLRMIHITALILILFFPVMNCTSSQVRFTSINDEIVIRPALKSFLKSHKGNVKIVLRTPDAGKDIAGSKDSADKQAKLDSSAKAYSIIEKELFKAGYIVRDRQLMSHIAAGERADYKKLGKKIDTDLILEITQLTNEHQLDITGEPMHSKIPGGKLECRIIIVSKGEIAGMFTIYQPPCDENNCTLSSDGIDWYIDGRRWEYGGPVVTIEEVAMRIAPKLVNALEKASK
jgi:hypothetical protein